MNINFMRRNTMKKILLAVLVVLIMVGVAEAQCPYPQPLGCAGSTISLKNNTFDSSNTPVTWNVGNRGVAVIGNLDDVDTGETGGYSNGGLLEVHNSIENVTGTYKYTNGLISSLTLSANVADFHNANNHYAQTAVAIPNGSTFVSDSEVVTYQNLNNFNNSGGTYTTPYHIGIDIKFNEIGASTGTYNITDLIGLSIREGSPNGSGTFYIGRYSGILINDRTHLTGTIPDAAGIRIDKQTMGTENHAIVLNGEGTGADIAFGLTKHSTISRQKVLISGAQLMDIKDTLITGIAAQGATKWIEVKGASLHYVDGGTNFTCGAGTEDIVLEYETSGTDVINEVELDGFIDQNNNEIRIATPIEAQAIDGYANLNKAIKIAGVNADCTAGDIKSALEIVIDYNVHTIDDTPATLYADSTALITEETFWFAPVNLASVNDVASQVGGFPMDLMGTLGGAEIVLVDETLGMDTNSDNEYWCYDSDANNACDDVGDNFALGSGESTTAAGTGFTIEGWFYFGNPAATKGLVSKWGGTHTEYGLSVLAADTLLFSMFDSDVNSCDFTTTGTITQDSWQHLAVVYNGGCKTNATCSGITIYKNGVALAAPASINCTSYDGMATTAGDANFNIGARDGGQVFDGKIGSVSITRAEHTATDILSSYEAEKVYYGF